MVKINMEKQQLRTKIKGQKFFSKKALKASKNLCCSVRYPRPGKEFTKLYILVNRPTKTPSNNI